MGRGRRGPTGNASLIAAIILLVVLAVAIQLDLHEAAGSFLISFFDPPQP